MSVSCIIVGSNMRVSIWGSNPHRASLIGTSPRSLSVVFNFIIPEVMIVEGIYQFCSALLIFYVFSIAISIFFS